MSTHATPARERRDDGGGDAKTQKMTMDDATLTMLSPPKARFKMMFRSNSPRIAVKDEGGEKEKNTTDMEV